MNIVEERERVAEMCAVCQMATMIINGKREWSARMWCNAIGEHVVGYGTTAWEAVQSAHALYNAESR